MNYKKYIISTFFSILVLLFIKGQYSHFLLTNSTYGMPALIKQQSIENLYIGSSMFRQGLDIQTLETTSNDSHYILAYNGNQPVWIYHQLLKLINHGAHINNLYIDMYAYSACEYPKIDDEKLLMEINLIEKWNLWELLTLNPNTAKAETFWSMFVNSNNELLLTWPIASAIINSQFHNGGTLTTPAGRTDEILQSLPIPSTTELINEIQEEYILKIISLAKENNINILFIETPKYEKIVLDSSYQKIMTQYVELLNKEQIPCLLSDSTFSQIAKSPNIYTYNFDNTNSEYFMDLIHLSYKGRIMFTDTFCKFTHHGYSEAIELFRYESLYGIMIHNHLEDILSQYFVRDE